MSDDSVKKSVRRQAVIYSTKAFVRVRKPLNSWVNWNHRLGGGPVLTVRTQGLEVSAPQGMMLESRDIVMSAENASMQLDKIGWAGTPIGLRECIHISGRDDNGSVELAISAESDLESAWQALLDAGVQPKSRQT
jgi:hypothetical protein